MAHRLTESYNSPVASDELFLPQEYVFAFLSDDDELLDIVRTTTDLKVLLYEIGLTELKDYNLSELDEVLNSDRAVILVADPDDIRWFEVPDAIDIENLNKDSWQDVDLDTDGLIDDDDIDGLFSESIHRKRPHKRRR